MVKALSSMKGNEIDTEKYNNFFNDFLAGKTVGIKKKCVESRINVLFKNKASLALGWLVYHVKCCYEQRLEDILQYTQYAWNSEKSYQLFNIEQQAALKSLLFIIKSNIFIPDFSIVLDKVKINTQARRTIFMIPRFDDCFLSIIQLKGDKIYVLFNIYWMDPSQGTLFVEKVGRSIPSILEGFEMHSGKTGWQIYEEVMKPRRVSDYDV